VVGRRGTRIDRSDIEGILERNGATFDTDLIIETDEKKFAVLNVQLNAVGAEDLAPWLNAIDQELHELRAHLRISEDTKLAYLWYDDLKFTALEIGLSEEAFSARPIFAGEIDADRVSAFKADIFDQMEQVTRTLGVAQGASLSEICPQDRANFLFLRSLLDYQSIGTSESLESSILDIYRRTRCLFEPSNDFWTEMTTERQRLLAILLLKLSGMFRRSFSLVVTDWRRMIEFLREQCHSDASNFFEAMAERLGLNRNDPLALEKMQLILEKKGVFPFTYSKKNGRFLLTVMSENRRGHGLLKSVVREHLSNFNLPVDSQVIRVSLNTGLIKMMRVADREIVIKNRLGRGLMIKRSDLTEPCQRAWRLVSSRVGLLPVELDIYVWSGGSLFCKHFGEYCFACPLTVVCDSWATKLVRESRGADWDKGTFSFCRPQTGVDRLILRDENTPHATEKYRVRTFGHEQELLDVASLKPALTNPGGQSPVSQ